MSSPNHKRLRTFFGKSTPPRAKSSPVKAKDASPSPSPKRKAPKVPAAQLPPQDQLRDAQAYINSLDLGDSDHEPSIDDKRKGSNWFYDRYEDEEYMETRCGEKIEEYEMVPRTPMTIELEEGTFDVFRDFRDFRPYRATFEKSLLRPWKNSDMAEFNFLNSRGIDIRWMLNDYDLHDVIVIVGPEHIAFLLHKVPLVASSPYFRKIIQSNVSMSKTLDPKLHPTIPLPTIPVNIFSAFVEWAYGGPEDDLCINLQDSSGCFASIQAYGLLEAHHLRSAAQSYAISCVMKSVTRPFKFYNDPEIAKWKLTSEARKKGMMELNTLFGISEERECGGYVWPAIAVVDGMSDAEMIAFAAGEDWMCGNLKKFAPRIVKNYFLEKKSKEERKRGLELMSASQSTSWGY